MTFFVVKESIDSGRSKRELLRHIEDHRNQLGLKKKYTEEELHKAWLKSEKAKLES